MGTKLYAVWDTEKGGWWSYQLYFAKGSLKASWWQHEGSHRFWAARHEAIAGKRDHPDQKDFKFDAQTRYVIREVTLQPVANDA